MPSSRFGAFFTRGFKQGFETGHLIDGVVVPVIVVLAGRSILVNRANTQRFVRHGIRSAQGRIVRVNYKRIDPERSSIGN